MREMILNHASLASAGRHEVTAYLADMATGMATLVRTGGVPATLRTHRSPHEIPCPDDRSSLWGAYQELRRSGRRDESVFLMSLTGKVSLLSGVGPEARNRFLACQAMACEAKALPQEEGEPLMLCAITDGVAVGFPSEPVWDRDRVTVAFRELLPNDTFEETDEAIDQLTRAVHAGPITDRHVRRLRNRIETPAELWSKRAEAFPHLTFGPDVEDQLGRLNPGYLGTVVKRLAELDEAASAWGSAGGPAPPWTCKVTPESESVMNSEQLREARRFRSVRGERLVFQWHARFGSGGRIHLRFDARAREMEIGYVGGHLPLD